MMNRSLDKKEWQSFFDAFSKNISHQQEQVEIEVANLEIGDQMLDEWIPLEGLSYDKHSDVLYVHTPSFEHAIDHPAEILVETDALMLHRIDVHSADGTSQTVRLRQPILLEGEVRRAAGAA